MFTRYGTVWRDRNFELLVSLQSLWQVNWQRVSFYSLYTFTRMFCFLTRDRWEDEMLTLLFDALCFRFVDSESTLGLTLPCASVSLLLAFSSTVRLTKSLVSMPSGAFLGILWGSQHSLFISQQILRKIRRNIQCLLSSERCFAPKSRTLHQQTNQMLRIGT